MRVLQHGKTVQVSVHSAYTRRLAGVLTHQGSEEMFLAAKLCVQIAMCICRACQTLQFGMQAESSRCLQGNEFSVGLGSRGSLSRVTDASTLRQPGKGGHTLDTGGKEKRVECLRNVEVCDRERMLFFI